MIPLVDILMTQAATPSFDRSEDENDQLFREAADALTDFSDALYEAWCALEAAADLGERGPMGAEYLRSFWAIANRIGVTLDAYGGRNTTGWKP